MSEKYNIPESNSLDSMEEAESSDVLEIILEPETKEKVVKKIKDINENGTAFSVVDSDLNHLIASFDKTKSKFNSIIRHGLVGVSYERQNGKFGTKNSATEYVNDLRSGSSPEVFFSIVGRQPLSGGPGSTSEDKGSFNEDKVRYSGYVWSNLIGENPVAFAFDLSRYEEQAHARNGLKHLEYIKHQWDERPNVDNRGERAEGFEYGFVLSGRVPPRFFTGIILKPNFREELVSDPVLLEGLSKTYGNEAKDSNGKIWHKRLDFSFKDGKYYYKKIDKEDTRRKVSILAKEMLSNIGTTDNIVPIYDFYGNVWWPEEISYEDVLRNKIKVKYSLSNKQFDEWIKLVKLERKDWSEEIKNAYREYGISLYSRDTHDEEFLVRYVKSKVN